MTTAMVDIDDFLPDVWTNARAVPEPVAIRLVREAAIEICRSSKAWRDTAEVEVDNLDGEGTPTFDDAQIHTIDAAWFNSTNKLEPKTPQWLDENVADWDTNTETVTPSYITQLQPNTFRLAPRALGTVKLRVVLLPSVRASTLPQFLRDIHATQIGRGAAGRAMLMPATDYANPQLGAALVAEFEAYRDGLQGTGAKGQQRARMRTKAGFF